MFQFTNSLGRNHKEPRSVFVYNYYYGFSAEGTPVAHETHSSDLDGSVVRFFMIRAVYEEMLTVLGSVPPEACGMLLGPASHSSLITHFVPDASGISSPTTFHIDGKRMTEAIKPFIGAGLDVKGICHSHPSGCYRPSGGDLTYLKRLFSNNKNATSATTNFYFPIISDNQIFHFAYDRTASEDALKSAKLALL